MNATKSPTVNHLEDGLQIIDKLLSVNPTMTGEELRHALGIVVECRKIASTAAACLDSLFVGAPIQVKSLDKYVPIYNNAYVILTAIVKQGRCDEMIVHKYHSLCATINNKHK